MIQFRGIYSGAFQGIAVTAPQDLFELEASSVDAVALLKLYLSQTTELGDAAEEVLRISVARATGSGGSGGGFVAQENHNELGASFIGSLQRNNTTPAGTQTVLQEYGWNIRIPFERVYTPETWIWIPPSGRLCVGLLAAPADSITMSGTLVFGVL